MVIRPSASYDGAILVFPVAGKAEFGIQKTEFGKASLFHAGFQGIGDFRKNSCNGSIINMRPKAIRHFHDALCRATCFRVKPFIFAKRRDDG
jgi:hypothetical protein